MSTFYNLPEINEQVRLFTHLVVRDDAHLLFGFSSQEERRLFRTLIKVNGVGAKMALTLLSGISAQEFANCIHENDTARLVKLPGIGKKTAERLIVEMRDRLGDWEIVTSPTFVVQTPTASSAETDAISALVSLGFKPQEASKHIHGLQKEGQLEGLSSEEMIRLALKASVMG